MSKGNTTKAKYCTLIIWSWGKKSQNNFNSRTSDEAWRGGRLQNKDDWEISQIISRTRNIKLSGDRGEGAGGWQNITDTKTPANASHLHLAPNTVEGSFISELPINGVLQLGAANPISLSALGITVYNYLRLPSDPTIQPNQYLSHISASYQHFQYLSQPTLGIYHFIHSFLSSAKLWHYQHFTQLSHPIFNTAIVGIIALESNYTTKVGLLNFSRPSGDSRISKS